jgi:hypothetical protein
MPAPSLCLHSLLIPSRLPEPGLTIIDEQGNEVGFDSQEIDVSYVDGPFLAEELECAEFPPARPFIPSTPHGRDPAYPYLSFFHWQAEQLETTPEDF